MKGREEGNVIREARVVWTDGDPAEPHRRAGWRLVDGRGRDLQLFPADLERSIEDFYEAGEEAERACAALNEALKVGGAKREQAVGRSAREGGR